MKNRIRAVAKKEKPIKFTFKASIPWYVWNSRGIFALRNPPDVSREVTHAYRASQN